MTTEEKRYESFNSLKKKTIELAKLIAEWSQKTGYQFDGMLVIPRGGFYPAMVLSQLFHLQAPAIVSASISSYSKDAKVPATTFRKGQVPLDSHVQGTDWLIVDDVFDTGQTVKELTDDLLKQGARSVRSACIYYKPGKSKVDIKPDFYVEKYDGWVDFAWEVDFDNLMDLAKQQIFRDVSFVAGKTKPS